MKMSALVYIVFIEKGDRDENECLLIFFLLGDTTILLLTHMLLVKREKHKGTFLNL